jgi:putative addiction module killer protein
MEIRPRDVRNYVTPEGREVFREWLNSVKDSTARAAIRSRIDRLLLGNFGDNRHLGEGLYELRIHFGAGYRVYLGEVDRENVVLLIGGTKRTQKRDIQKAKDYWQELRSRDL